MKKNNKYIIINTLDKYYKYYAGRGTFTTKIEMATILKSYESCVALCGLLNEPNFRKLIVRDAKIVFRKEKLQKLIKK